MKSNRQRRQEIVDQLDIIWHMSESETLQEFAAKVKLDVRTVTRIYYGSWKYIRVDTLQKLGEGVGLDINLTPGGITASLKES